VTAPLAAVRSRHAIPGSEKTRSIGRRNPFRGRAARSAAAIAALAGAGERRYPSPVRLDTAEDGGWHIPSPPAARDTQPPITTLGIDPIDLVPPR